MRGTPKFLLASCVLLLAWPTVARADEAGSAENRARAEQLFDSALADSDAGRFEAACPKFAASQAADPKTTTLLNLAGCYVQTGKKASAWATYREAESMAARAKRPDLERSARVGAEALAPALVRLAIRVPERHRVPGLVVERDGVAISRGEWEVEIPLDEGVHSVGASATGRRPWRLEVELRGRSRTIDVPELAIEARPQATVVAPLPFPVAAAPVPAWTPLRTAGGILAVTGSAATIGGIVMGLVANANYGDARATCNAADDCSRDAVLASDRARSLATAATVVGITGAVVGLAGLVIVWLQAPSRRAGPAGALSPSASLISGRW